MKKAPNAEIQKQAGSDVKHGNAVVDADGISRRAWLEGAALVGVGAVCMMSTRAAAQSKSSQADAKYQDQPKGQAKCDGCSQFQPPEACAIVDGKISPNGWCQLYSPKA